MPKLPKIRLNVTVKQVFTGLVMFMWAASFLADLANPKYDPPDYINPLIMLVGGYLFATSANKREDHEDRKTTNKKEDKQ